VLVEHGRERDAHLGPSWVEDAGQAASELLELVSPMVALSEWLDFRELLSFADEVNVRKDGPDLYPVDASDMLVEAPEPEPSTLP
jgi:hypothetical protein